MQSLSPTTGKKIFSNPGLKSNDQLKLDDKVPKGDDRRAKFHYDAAADYL